MKRVFRFLAIVPVILMSCQPKADTTLSMGSPTEVVKMTFGLTDAGQPYYLSSFENREVVDTSFLGFELGDNVSLSKGLKVASSEQTSFDEIWEQPWGEERFIRNNYNQLKVNLETTEGYKLNIIIFCVH